MDHGPQLPTSTCQHSGSVHIQYSTMSSVWYRTRDIVPHHSGLHGAGLQQTGSSQSHSPGSTIYLGPIQGITVPGTLSGNDGGHRGTGSKAHLESKVWYANDHARLHSPTSGRTVLARHDCTKGHQTCLRTSPGTFNPRHTSTGETSGIHLIY